MCSVCAISLMFPHWVEWDQCCHLEQRRKKTRIYIYLPHDVLSYEIKDLVLLWNSPWLRLHISIWIQILLIKIIHLCQECRKKEEPYSTLVTQAQCLSWSIFAFGLRMWHTLFFLLPFKIKMATKEEKKQPHQHEHNYTC